MNAHQRRIEKRRKARSLYPTEFDFPAKQITYGVAAGGIGTYRTDRLGRITHKWPDRDSMTELEEVEYERYKKFSGYELNLPKEDDK